MRRAVLDSNGVDPLVETDEALQAVREAVADGRLQLLGTYVLEEELAGTTDPEWRAKLQRILPLVTDTPTAGIVFNSFRFDRGAWGDEHDSERIDHLRAGRMDGTHTNDALLANTALRDGAALVTADKGLINRIRRLDPAPEVLHPRDLLTEIGYVAPAP